ncbi:MAG: ArsA family ATPase [Desulfobacterales bacterium]|nr:ArsA family ATPase [Desulfobacterales bacterium]
MNPETHKDSPLFLRNNHLRLLFFGGKGGVGKTTCATATALRLAERTAEASFLIVSTDPAHSLADSLADITPPHNLKVIELDAGKSLAAFKENHTQKLREIASRGTFFDGEDINGILDLSLPGMDELMAFLEIAGWVENETYDCIVVDTAPTGHTLRLLAMPLLIKRWLDALDALLAKHRYMKKLFRGSYQPDELDKFLSGLAGSVKQMEALLQDPKRCCFVPVMLAEALSVTETLRLLAGLKQSKIPVTDIVVNRLYPESVCMVCSDRHIRQMGELAQLEEKISVYSLWGVSQYPQEIRGAAPLEMFWQGLFPLKNPKSTPVEYPKDSTGQAINNQQSPINNPERSIFFNQQSTIANQQSKLPAPEKRLLVFAGKGGVGKTTLACATAVRMARTFPDKGVFLFSTDPAHSLSDCLGKRIGPEPTELIPGLTAMEIDAQAEFDGLKKKYAAELERFLVALSPDLDLTFDREVMERVMDLSPPGLDEVMALTLAMGFLAADQYQVFVLDSAPTGHLIRLLETPELIQQWLKMFFNLFLKYKRVFRLPGISEQMIRISKDLKRLRALLKDSDRSALYAVTILTEMAFQETTDLVDACRRMGINVPALFLNLATPDSECPLCSARYRNEEQIREKFKHAFPEKPQVLVHYMGETRGMQRIQALGEALYD